jgi:hypothetical protein
MLYEQARKSALWTPRHKIEAPKWPLQQSVSQRIGMFLRWLLLLLSTLWRGLQQFVTWFIFWGMISLQPGKMQHCGFSGCLVTSSSLQILLPNYMYLTYTLVIPSGVI